MLLFTSIRQDRILELGDINLFLIWDEDNCVHIYPSAASATLAIEALDVGAIKAAFDGDAHPCRIEWVTPNRPGINGEYRFVVATEPNLPALAEMIGEADAIMSEDPNRTIDEFVQKLINLIKER